MLKIGTYSTTLAVCLLGASAELADSLQATFLHFWCNRDCDLTKEQAYHEVVDALLEFNTDLYSSMHQV